MRQLRLRVSCQTFRSEDGIIIGIVTVALRDGFYRLGQYVARPKALACVLYRPTTTENKSGGGKVYRSRDSNLLQKKAGVERNNRANSAEMPRTHV